MPFIFVASTGGVSRGGIVAVGNGMEAERLAAQGVAVLGLYDLARCHAAIEAVERRDKPVAEIPIVVSVAKLGHLIDDLMRSRS